LTSLTEVHGKGTVEATECQEILQLLVFQNSPARAGLLFIAPNYTVVCMARLFFTYAYGSWGICKGKLSKRKSNSEVSLQKHRATRQVSRDPTNPETDHGSTQLLVSLQRQPERVCVRPHFINAWEETPPFQRVQQLNNGSSQVTLTSSCTVQSFHQILLHEVTRLFGLRLKARCTLLSFLNVLYECAPLPHPPPIHNKNCKVFVRVKDL
jgi:hypothetical protein